MPGLEYGRPFEVASEPAVAESHTAGADFSDLTSELLAATIALTHPDKHPPERISLIHRMKTCAPLLKERPIRRVYLAGSLKKREQSLGESEFAFEPSNAQSSM
jgi:hypothetical protein